MIVLWNPLNFLDGEIQWLLGEFGIIAVAIFLALLLPSFQACIWYTAFLYSSDMVTDHFLSEGFPVAWVVLHGISLFLLFFPRVFVYMKKECSNRSGTDRDIVIQYGSQDR